MTTPNKALLQQALGALQYVVARNFEMAQVANPVGNAIAALQAAINEPDAEPVAYLAWRDGKPCYEGDDAVCEDAVWPVDADDDRTSRPVYLHPAPRQPLTDAEILDAIPGGMIDCLGDPWDCGVGDGDETRSLKQDVIRIARAIEAAHGVKP